uniref:Uncharacterized protein n=1 Tax=Ciona intestinalis TaxID=7719 RepID=H2XVG0_CIOIN
MPCGLAIVHLIDRFNSRLYANGIQTNICCGFCVTNMWRIKQHEAKQYVYGMLDRALSRQTLFN